MARIKKTRNMHSREEQSENSLLEALRQNWEHSRHGEIQRQQQLYFIILLFGATIAIMTSLEEVSLLTLSNYWPLFLFLAIVLVISTWNVTKWNIEFGNHIREIQWISEKLGLNQPLSEKKHKQIEKLNISKVEKNKLKKDAMFQGYMGLPLPLSIRVHKAYGYLFHFLLGITLFLFFISLLIDIFNRLSTIFPLSLLQSNMMYYSIVYAVGFIFAISLTTYHFVKMNSVYAYAEKLKDIRTPEGLELKYEREVS